MPEPAVKASSREENALKPKKRRSLTIRVLRVLAVITFLPLVLIGLVVGYLHTSNGKARVRALIVSKLGPKVDGTVELGDLDYSIGGSIHVGGLKLKDTSGDTGVALDSLTITPSWSDLLHGRAVISKVALSGLHLHVVKLSDGTTNLDHFLHFEKPEPSDKPIRVDALEVKDVSVAIDEVDGTKISIENLALAGHLSAVPKAKDADIDVTPISLDVTVDKPGESLKLAIQHVSTGITAHLEGGKGSLTLHPVTGTVVIARAGSPEKKLEVGLGESTFEVGPGTVGVSLAKILAGALAIGSIEVRGSVADGKLDGSQRADVVGVHVDAGRVNELLGKDLLGSDVDIDAHVSGPPDKIALDAKVKTSGGNVGLNGTIGVSDPTKPSYNLDLTLDDVASKKLLSSAISAPAASVKKASIHLQGSGKALDSMNADASVHVEGISAKDITVDDIACDAHVENGKVTLKSLEVSALEQKVRASGSVELQPKVAGGPPAPKHVELSVSVEGDPGRAVALLKKAGIPVDAKLPEGLLVLRPGDLTLGVSGDVDGQLEVKVASPGIRFAGGTIGIDAKAQVHKLDPPVDGKKIDVDGFDAHLTLSGVQIPSVLALQGKSLPGMNAWVGGTIDATGTPSDPKANLNLDITAVRADGGGKPITTHIGGTVEKTAANLDVHAKRGDAPLLDIVAHVPLALQSEPKGPDFGAPFSLKLHVPETSFEDLIDLLPPPLVEAKLKGKTIPPGSVAADVDIEGALARPAGTFDVVAKTDRLALPALPVVPERKVHVNGSLTPDGAKTNVAAKAEVWLDASAPALVTLDANASIQGSPLTPGPKPLTWNADLEVPTIAFAALPVSDKALKALGGTVGASVKLYGNENDALGSVHLDAHDLQPNGGGPVDVSLAVNLDEGKTSVSGDVDLAKALLVRIGGDVGVAGKGLLARARAHAPLDPTLALTVDVPERAVASLSALRPPLAAVPGNLKAHIELNGTASEPLAKGDVTVEGFKAVNGDAGKIAIALNASHDELSANIGLGTGTEPPVRIEAHAPRAAVLGLSTGGSVPLTASARANKVDLRSLLPTFALDKVHGLGVRGDLDWNMDFTGSLEKEGQATKLVSPLLTGDLSLTNGEIDIPGTKRTYKNVTIRVSAAPDALHIDRIGATESDLEVTHRWLEVSGDLAWHDLKPTRADVDIRAEKWLLFGTKNIGLADAPRGTLSIDAHAGSSLDAPVKKATVEVKKLEVLFPDRYEKAHQPEDSHVGDVLVVGDTLSGGQVVEPGKLPLPASALENAEHGKEGESSAVAKDGEAEPSGLDVDIQIDKGARLFQAPIDLSPEGTIHIESRKTGRKIRGALAMQNGSLSLGGADHPLTSGSLTFDDTHPSGWIDLSFAKHMKPSALRDMADDKASDDIMIHMFGPISDRRTVLSGAGSPGALWDLLAMHNEGRPRFLTEPGMPASNTVQYPTHEGMLVLSFISVNLPHLLFLDRVEAWADPYDSFDSYGQIQHYEAQRFFADGKGRVLATQRPPSVGTSEDEVELDYCFTNTSRTLFGVGALAGSRGGGGADLFFEWSSKD